ncbi:MAG: glycosyltransferase family 87 protein [Flavobacteriales bacterium]
MASVHAHKPSRADGTKVEWFAGALVVFLGVLLLAYRAVSDGIAEKGDGIQHYMIARYSWAHPHLFVDHWGKPLFTLLASPFAQLGYAGMACFNALLAILTGFFANRVLRSAGGIAQLTFPLLVMLSPQYAQLVVNGMTEVLFGLLTVLTVYLLFEKRYVLAALVVSFTPFSRPEYALFLPMVAVWIAWCKQWKALPWLGVGFVVYGIAGALLIGDPLWYWHSDPYHVDNDTYGSGDLFHFVDHAGQIFGQPLLVLGLLACASWPVLYWRLKDQRNTLLMLAAVCAVPVLATLGLHSLIWWKGTFGSAGLWRVVATVVPIAALFTGHVLISAASIVLSGQRLRTALGAVGIVTLAGWSWSDLHSETELPFHANEEQWMLDEAGDSIKRLRTEGLRVHSTHPYIAYRAGLDQFDTLQYIAQYGYPTPIQRGWNTRPGDLMVWESKYGPNESYIPIDSLLADEQFALREAFCSNNSYRAIGQYPQEVLVFSMDHAKRVFVRDTLWGKGVRAQELTPRIDSTRCADNTDHEVCLLPNLYPYELRGLQVPTQGVIFDVINVEMDVSWLENNGEQPALVLAQEMPGSFDRFEPMPLPQGKFSITYRMPPQCGGQPAVLYLYNVGLTSITVKDVLVTRDRWTQQLQ